MSAGLPAALRWSRPGRLLVFLLAAASIWCLLAEFYGLCSMRTFTLVILIPATAVLVGIALLDRVKGEGLMWWAVVTGAGAGLVAALAYDVFRLPFVFSSGPWHLDLYKPFPRFGAMILGQPLEQPAYSLAAQAVGWVYHFSNGAMFGVMYAALAGDVRRRSWVWAAAMAVGIELAMLATPYPAFFAIPVTAFFVVVTLAAHLVFGVTLGLAAKRVSA